MQPSSDMWLLILACLCHCLLLGPSPTTAFRGYKENIKFLLLSDLSYLSNTRGVMEEIASAANDILEDKKYNALVSNDSIQTKQYPSALLNIVASQLRRNPQMNSVFFYCTNKHVNKAAVQYLTEMISSLGIPFMAAVMNSTFPIKGNANTQVLLLSPRIRDYCVAMLGLMKHYSWDQFSILTSVLKGYEEFIGTLEKLTSQEDSDGFEFTILSKMVIDVETQGKGTIETALQDFKAMDTRVILLFMTDDEASEMFEVAHRLDMTGSEYVWIASEPVISRPLITSNKPPPHFPVGLLGLHPHNISVKFTSSEMMLRYAKMAIRVWAHGIVNMLEAKEKTGNPLFSKDSLKPNIIWGNDSAMLWKGGPILHDFMKNVTQEGIGFNEDGTSSRLKLNIFNYIKEDKYKFKKIGEYQKPRGLTLKDITWAGNELSPPTGKPSRYFLRVVTLREQPYVVYNDPDNGKCPPQAELCRIAAVNDSVSYGNDTTNSSIYQCCSGLCIDLLNLLSKEMRFDYELFQVEDGIWGAYDEETGEWNGLVRAIMDHKADMVVTSLKITPERNEMIDFSIPFLETGITIIVAVRDGVISPTAFLEPLGVLCWVFILVVCIAVMATTMLIFEWLSHHELQQILRPEPYDYPSWCLILVFSVHASGAAIFIFEWLSPSGLDRGNKPIRGKQQEHRFSLFRSFWLIWAMLLKATVNVDNPRGISSRFLASIWALFAVVFTASYTANLAAFMITEEDYDKLDGIKDWRLVRPETHKPPFKFATIPSGSTETNLRKFHPKMYEYMRKYNRATVEEGIKAVKDGNINAFIYDATVLEYNAGRDDQCKLRTVGNWYAMTGYGIGFPKGSKWIDIVNKHLIRLQYDGALERLQKYWLAGACKKNSEQGESSSSLGILNFTSAFILLAGGMLLGGLLLLLEHIYFKFFRSRLRKWDKCGCCGLVSLSMGKSLTFEQSVREAIDLQKHYKCKNPICETQGWKLKHELDLALLKIDNLQKQMGEVGITPDRRPPALWRNQGGPRRPPPAIGWKPEVVNPQDDPPGPGWKPGVVAAAPSWNSPGPPGMGGGEGFSGEPSCRPRPAAGAASVYPYPPWNYDDTPQRPKRPKGEKSNRKGSKSLPNSPIKRSLTAPGSDSWKTGPPTYEDVSSMGNNVEPGAMKRTTSFPNARDTLSTSPGSRRAADKRTRYHKGNVYVEVDGGHVEKETVL